MNDAIKIVEALLDAESESPKDFLKRKINNPSASAFGGALRYANGRFTWSDGTPGQSWLEAVHPGRFYNFAIDGGYVLVPRRYWQEDELQAFLEAFPGQGGVKRIPLDKWDRFDRNTLSSVYWPTVKQDEVLAKARALGWQG